MRNLCWFVAFLFMSVNVLAQKKDTVYKDASKIVIGGPDDHPKIYNKPLIIVNGIEYNGELNQIDPNSMAEISVVKDSVSRRRYGKKGENGIIFITTKGHQNILSLNKNDSVYRSDLPDDAMYVIDGVMSDKKLDGIDPKEILSINVLKKNNTTGTGIDPAHDMVIVITKAGAIRSYQKKLSDLSALYKKYLGSHNGDDSGLTYVVDGDVYNKDGDDLEKLYKLSKDKIAKVAISTKDKVTSVTITTKK